ncbi:MAG: hypothetical protein HYT76_03505 [Deltaproteobacteria bacterium]|nr:hypothetical protein [Deltaproteobacteria bacterium]
MHLDFLIRGSELDESLQYAQSVLTSLRRYRRQATTLAERFFEASRTESAFIPSAGWNIHLEVVNRYVWDPAMRSSLERLVFPPNVMSSYRYLWLLQKRYDLLTAQLQDSRKFFRGRTEPFFARFKGIKGHFQYLSFPTFVDCFREVTGLVPTLAAIEGFGTVFAAHVDGVSRMIPEVDLLAHELGRARIRLYHQRLALFSIGLLASAAVVGGALYFLVKEFQKSRGLDAPQRF